MNRSTWRKKAINNRLIAISLSEEFGGDIKTYLRKSNQVLRSKIISANIEIKEIPARKVILSEPIEKTNYGFDLEFAYT